MAELSTGTSRGEAYWGQHALSLNCGWGKGQRTSRIGQSAFGSGHSVSAEALRDHLIELISAQSEASPRGVVCPFPPILAEAHFAENLPLLESGVATTHPSPCPLGGCYSDLMDLSPYSCCHTWEWTPVWATGHNCLLLYVTWPYPPGASALGHTAAPLVFRSAYGLSGECIWLQEGQVVHRLHQQHIQLGLRKGMAVLVYYRVQGGPHANTVFQAVLIAHESAATRAKKTENSLWKRVVSSETEFGSLLTLHGPSVVMLYAGEAIANIWLSTSHTWHGRAFQANISIVDMIFLGDTRSAEELAVFTNMAPERLCLGCRLRVDEKFTSIFLGEQGPLFAASVKLLQFALRVSSASTFAKELTEEEAALRQAIRP